MCACSFVPYHYPILGVTFLFAMLSVVMPNVVVLSAVMLSVVAPFWGKEEAGFSIFFFLADIKIESKRN